jgi:hypothetical protein
MSTPGRLPVIRAITTYRPLKYLTFREYMSPSLVSTTIMMEEEVVG